MVRKKKTQFNPEDPIVIDNNKIEVGQSEAFKIIVGRTPSDNQNYYHDPCIQI